MTNFLRGNKLSTAEIIEGLTTAILKLDPRGDTYVSDGVFLKILRRHGILEGLTVGLRDSVVLYEYYISPHGQELRFTGGVEETREQVQNTVKEFLMRMMTLVPLNDLSEELKAAPPSDIGELLPQGVVVSGDKVWDWGMQYIDGSGVTEIIDHLRDLLPRDFIDDKMKSLDPAIVQIVKVDLTGIADISDIPVMSDDMYCILSARTQVPLDLALDVIKSRGGSVYPKYEVKKAYGILYLLNQYKKDPVNWEANAHAELKEFERLKLERFAKDPKNDYRKSWVWYDENKHLAPNPG